jgi:hypothetical protein
MNKGLEKDVGSRWSHRSRDKAEVSGIGIGDKTSITHCCVWMRMVHLQSSQGKCWQQMKGVGNEAAIKAVVNGIGDKWQECIDKVLEEDVGSR